ncbi:type II secretion system F family protein [Salinibacterium sp. ZJ454]|uniref:type II secretion system F family protein n=1 Tax=Salinibacterium sp. ZJ454 TaxID=2708339 RepID=UPI001422E7F3|nr:type II secretion system F family protein [Salinibacterium sp. ZJ454]
MTGRNRPPRLDEVASVVQRLAVLLAAGVAPASAWRYLTAQSPVVAEVNAALETGASVAAAIDDAADRAPPAEAAPWQALAAAWAIASDAGAPMAPALREFAASLRSLAQAQRDIAVALAEPIATARLVMVLPAVALLFGMLLGFNTVTVLFGSPLGLVCLGGGAGLLVAARAWNRRLVASAQPTDLTPGLLLDLAAIALSGGAPVDRARASALSAAAARGIATADTATLDDVLDLSRRAGVPAAELLRSEADERRRSARSDSQQKAAALSIRLMLPLGVCVLPAFMLLGVAPLMLSVISSTVQTF